MSSKIIASTTSGTALNMSADTSGVLEIQTGLGPTTAITVDASQNVGIGTSSPSYKLHVNSATYSTIIGLQNTSNTYQQNLFGVDLYHDLTNTAGAVTWRNKTSVGESMRIDDAGRLLVGTTSAQGIGTTISGSYMYQRSSGTAGVFRYNGGDAANNYVVYNQSNIGVFLTDGGVSWVSNTSDARLKNKVSNIENALDAVQKLKALTFRYKKEDQTITPRYGFFAQNVGEAIPDAMIVSPEKDENIEGDIYTYDTAIINVYMVKAIQEQQALIKSLTTRLTVLEAK